MTDIRTSFSKDVPREEAPATNTKIALGLAAGMIIFGTLSTELSAIQFSTYAEGVDSCHQDNDNNDDNYCKFNKPYFNTLVMKFGMSLCFFIYSYEKRQAKKRKAETGGSINVSLLEANAPQMTTEEEQRDSWGTLCRIIIPAFTDLVQTTLAMGGLLFVAPSVYQMCRGSVVIFSAILTQTWLKKNLECYQIIAVFLVLIAIILVGISGVLGTDDKDDDDAGSSAMQQIIGLFLIVIGQFIGAVQFILEEELMTKYFVTPTQLVAWEGIWGGLICLVLYIPLYYTPSGGDASVIWHENVFDALTQISNSSTLLWCNIISIFVLLSYNLVGNMITMYLSAVSRSMLEACRTMGVWSVGLVAYYAAGNDSIGEVWTNFSFLELIGFFILVWGTLAYKGIVPINPCELLKKSGE